MLDAAWADGNVGTTNLYQVDHDEHWTTSSPEYKWLAADLASHPGGVKMAVFHFPLRSDNSTQRSDTILQNSSANPNAHQPRGAPGRQRGPVAFNGHAHTYQRITPATTTGQIINYVTGGGGGILEPVSQGSTCTGLLATGDIYALGWSPSGTGPTSGTGSSCGPGTSTPQSAAEVYNFLEVKVTGTTVTVTPINAAGQSFDVQTYTPTTVTANPSTPANVTATATSSSSIQINWNASTETGGAIADYTVSRSVSGGSYSQLATVAAPATTYTDTTAKSGVQYTYRITATDNGSPPQTSAAGHVEQGGHPVGPGGRHGHGHVGGVGRPRVDGLDGGGQRDHRLVPDRPEQCPAGLGLGCHRLHRRFGPARHHVHLLGDGDRLDRSPIHPDQLQPGDHPGVGPSVQRAPARAGGQQLYESPPGRLGGRLGRRP